MSSLREPRFVIAAAVLVCLSSAWPRAMQVNVDAGALQEAIAIGQSRLTGERDRFHQPYRFDVSKAPVDYLDVITPFRRVVLAAQAKAEIGDRSFGQREALQALADAPDILEFDIEFTFHPLNTYLGVPDYRVALIPSGATPATRSNAPVTPVEPQSLDRVPRYGPRVAGVPLPHPRPGGAIVTRRSGPMLGGTVIAQFDLRMLDSNGSYDVVISEEGKELARARVDLGKLR